MIWRTWVWRGPFIAMLLILTIPMIGLLIAINFMDTESLTDRIVGNLVLLAAFVLLPIMHTWIEVNTGSVRIGFFPLYRRSLKISEIRYVMPVEFNPMRDFAGYGIKGLAKSRNGLLLGGNPSRGIMIEMQDRRRYVLSFVDSSPILAALAEHGCTLATEIGDDSSR